MNDLSYDRNRRILIIDDNRAIHHDFRKILCPSATATATALDTTEEAVFGSVTPAVDSIRFELDSAFQGQEGMLRVKQAIDAGRPYAVAFVDVRMPPGWDGVETTEKIWEIDPDIQIVICTAYSDYTWDEMFAKLGRHDGLLILKKPFDAVEAFQLATALTEKWDLHRQSRQKMEDLERRVAARTAELVEANKTLQAEIAGHQRTERELQFKNIILSTQQEVSPDGILVVDEHARILSFNHRFAQLWGITAELKENNDDHPILEFVAGQVADTPAFLQRVRFLYEHQREIGQEEIRLKDGRIFDRFSAPMFGPDERYYGRVWFFRDITARKKFEAHMIQSQKMETVGKLAGGIAHEFNSILTAIIGQSELLFNDLPAGSPLATSVKEIRDAASRAAALTRQLLAYARRQFMQPETLDLNRLITGMDEVLRNLMGRETVSLNIVPTSETQMVKADAGQLEQVIINLAMNSRDAMPNGGKFTLETASVSIADNNLGAYSELKPGNYVMLAVSDTGVGMSDETKAHVFEPFFSTKGIGGGTGLGLSTCYGIIKQSGGHMNVYSEPSRGTTFKIYLPRVETPAQAPVEQVDLPALPRGTETILLVEDDPALRDMGATLLRRLGYTVLAAVNGIEALSLCHKRKGRCIDLLFSDVVMPHMSGRELADRMRVLYPQTRILFTSAYTENAIVNQGVLDKGVELLQKPFTPSALANKVRQILDAQ